MRCSSPRSKRGRCAASTAPGRAGAGDVSVVGPNGAGKTNLVEALYFALTGRSFRTADRRDLIPFGGSLARAEATVRDEDGLERGCSPRSAGPKAAATCSTATPPTRRRGAQRPAVAVFARSPDLVKGPPAERRAHLDAFAGALWPAAGELRRRTPRRWHSATRCSPKSAAVRRPGDLAAWTRVGRRRRRRWSRREPGERRAGARSPRRPAELGLEGGAEVVYAPRGERSAEEILVGLEQRREADVKPGYTCWGPHRDE